MIALFAAAMATPVEVVVQDEDGRRVAGADVGGQRTDARGRVTVELPEGPQRLLILAPGYAPVTRLVDVPVDRPVRVRLSAADVALEVVVEGQRVSANPTRHVIDAEKADETPGALDDAVRLVQSLPSVTVQREYSPSSGALSVRGAAPQDSRYFLDGIEIPYLYHFNQYASVFPASQIDTLELLPSTFSSAYGDATGAIVDARSKLDVPTTTTGSAHLNFVMAGGDVRAPIGDDGLWFSASGRRSYQDLFGEQSAQYPVWPIFHDTVLRLEKGDDRNGVGAFFASAGDGYQRAVDELDLLDPVEAEQTPVVAYAESFQLGGVTHRFRGARHGGRLVAAVVHHRRDGSLGPLGAEAMRAWTGVVRADLDGRPHRHLGWETGLELRAGQTSLEVEPAGPDALRVARELPGLARGNPVDGQLTRRQLGVYGTALLGPEQLVVMPGLRVDTDDANGRAALGPRTAIRIAPRQGTALTLAGGRYTQRPRTELLFPGSGAPDLPTTASWQLAASLEQVVAGRLELGLDAYEKRSTNPLVYPIDAAVFAADTGEARGVELTARYRLRQRLFVAAWVGHQLATLTVDGVARPADADQRWSGGLVASWDIDRTQLGLRYRGASGLPFTQLTGSLYDAGADRWSPVVGPNNGERLPAYHKVDLRVAYTAPTRFGALSASAEVWIVPRSAAQLYPTWNHDYTEQAWVVGPTLLPLLGGKATF